MQTCFPEWHNGKEWPIHHRDSDISEPFIYSAQDYLTQFILNAKLLQVQHLLDLVHRCICCIQHKTGLQNSSIPQADPVTASPSFYSIDFSSIPDLYIRAGCKLIQEILFQDLRIVGILLCEEGPIAHTFPEVQALIHILAEDTGVPAEFPEFLCVCP